MLGGHGRGDHYVTVHVETPTHLTAEQREAARRVVQPQEAGVFFANFENVLLQALFAMPENWGLSIEELEALRDEEE